MRHHDLTNLAALCGLSEAEALWAPSVFDKFRATGCSMRDLFQVNELRDYFAQVCRKLADSPEGRELHAEFLAQKGAPC